MQSVIHRFLVDFCGNFDGEKGRREEMERETETETERNRRFGKDTSMTRS